MKNSQSPAGPGRATQERKDAASTREQLEELPGDTTTGTAAGAQGEEGQKAARHAERNAHTRTPGTDANSPSRGR